LTPEQQAEVDAPINFPDAATEMLIDLDATVETMEVTGKQLEMLGIDPVAMKQVDDALASAKKQLDQEIYLRNQELPTESQIPEPTKEQIEDRATKIIRDQKTIEFKKDNLSKYLYEHPDQQTKYNYYVRAKKDRKYYNVVAGQELQNQFIEKENGEKLKNEIEAVEELYLDKDSPNYKILKEKWRLVIYL